MDVSHDHHWDASLAPLADDVQNDRAEDGYGQKALTFFLTVIQAAVMLRKFQLTDNGFGSRLAAGLFLMAGGFLLIWLSVENDKNGLGGISLILMANMFFYAWC
ncbi:hypothetical protein ACXO1P_04580 [Lactobacillus delbrueckii subsp. bulgaricus]|nr:hypothetical protein [Lactobacillus delbrueckii]MBT8808268.1 hypothetical protein [Lactobacillus delbrueckii subsp. bulgaricus]MBT8811052.1 hypothetical protein [Lactobacillus delbrueckii subsp. bulgaricus]MBT8817415.1 hypothetical protein [Lactobacillus delbrueckii subsp. bulgaricus]MBT8829152.1 hypothetical protein [Lactobacillus delbrueckii subsp. bulgaricus]MBT8833287.1 hypothetical protein [Lactobacillus delbrueckii subsp. bulgaricus]